MIINSDTLALAFKGFQTKFTDAFVATETDWPKVAMEVPSAAGDETYGWLGRFPDMREWLGACGHEPVRARLHDPEQDL